MPILCRNIHKFKSLLILAVVGALIALVLFSIKNSKRIQYAEEWAIFNYGQLIEGQTGTSGIDTNILPAQKITLGLPEVVIAVIDTGVDTSCDIFANNTILSGWDFYNNDSSVFDSYLYDYHGTYICTTIAKIAPNVTLLPVKFMESTYGSVGDAVAAIEFAIEQGADIVNCSWNFYEYDEALYNVIKNNPDILFVCAAGNYNANLDEIAIFPCSYQLDNIINVLAMDNTGKVFRTSGYGKETVHIAAPGASVKVILPENDETYIDGTSIATAFVSAAAGLMLSIDDTMCPSEISEKLISSATNIDTLEDKCISGGLVNIFNAICSERSKK